MSLPIRGLVLAAASTALLAGSALAQERTLTINTDASDPAPKRAFEQCYAVILEARAKGRLDIVRCYTEWIVCKLGRPYDDMIAWAAANGFPDLTTVRRYWSR